MKLSNRRTWVILLLGLALASALGMQHRDFVHRCSVDPAACGNDSDYIEVRGFLLSWYVSEPLPELGLPMLRRVLAVRFILSTMALVALMAANGAVFGIAIDIGQQLSRRARWLPLLALSGGYLLFQLVILTYVGAFHVEILVNLICFVTIGWALVPTIRRSTSPST